MPRRRKRRGATERNPKVKLNIRNISAVAVGISVLLASCAPARKVKCDEDGGVILDAQVVPTSFNECQKMQVKTDKIVVVITGFAAARISLLRLLAKSGSNLRSAFLSSTAPSSLTAIFYPLCSIFEICHKCFQHIVI